MRRFIGLWGIVFALLWGGIIGSLVGARHTRFTQYGMLISGMDGDIYRYSLTQNKTVNITRTPHQEESIQALPLRHNKVLVGRFDHTRNILDYYYIGWNSEILSPIFHTPQGKYRLFGDSSNAGDLLFAEGRYGPDSYVNRIGIIHRDGTSVMLTPPDSLTCGREVNGRWAEAHPTWSPDQQWIYFEITVCDESYTTMLYRMRADGSDRQALVKVKFSESRIDKK